MSEVMYYVLWKSPERPKAIPREYMLMYDTNVCDGYIPSALTWDGYSLEAYSVHDEEIFLATISGLQILYEYECEVFRQVDLKKEVCDE
jgi:hypothetical protein